MISRSLRQALNRVLAFTGHELLPRERDGIATSFTTEGVFRRISARSTAVGTVLDVGAAAGRWTRKALAHFPEAQYLLIEPLEERRASLETLCASHDNLRMVFAVAGDRVGTVAFDVSSDLDGSGVYGGRGAAGREVPMTTLDAEVERLQLPAPYFIKLDTHGFELPILAGAQKTLAKTSVLLVEAYNFQLTEDSVRFPELCGHLEAHGFRCADLADPMLRPDGVLWQMDLVFLPSDSECFAESRFATISRPQAQAVPV